MKRAGGFTGRMWRVVGVGIDESHGGSFHRGFRAFWERGAVDLAVAIDEFGKVIEGGGPVLGRLWEVQSDGLLFKSTVATEGDERFVYTIPSTEHWDMDDEKTLQAALASSKDHFLKFGNIDIGHFTLLGAAMGIKHPELYEIGQPVEVKLEPRIMVKARLYRGDGETARQAELFWSSMTEQTPAQRWYPSVGGYFPQKQRKSDGRAVVTGVVWNNIGFAKEPRNRHVPEVTLSPDQFYKAVTAGYGTDAAGGLAGGGALRVQSIEGEPQRTHEVFDETAYKRAASAYLKALKNGCACGGAQGKPTLAKIVQYFTDVHGIEKSMARRYAERMGRDVLAARRAGNRLQE